jgi:acyl carrier protein
MAMPETEILTQCVHQERFETVRRFIAERLFREVEEVHLESKLIADLGADSLDFIDIQFQIEKRFGFEFHKDELLDTTHRWVENGYLKSEVVDRFGEHIPELSSLPDPAHIPITQLFQLITVRTLLSLVEAKLKKSDQSYREREAAGGEQ